MLCFSRGIGSYNVGLHVAIARHPVLVTTLSPGLGAGGLRLYAVLLYNLRTPIVWMPDVLGLTYLIFYAIESRPIMAARCRTQVATPEKVVLRSRPCSEAICYIDREEIFLQKPTYFNKDADNAINYEAIGMVIGHEMTHGFDDQGRKYDQFGNLTNWWTRGDEESSMRALGLEFMNTIDPSSYWSEPQCKLTLGENIADLGQTLLIRIYLSKKAESDKIDRFTGDQRFIMGLHRVGGNRSGRRLLERL